MIVIAYDGSQDARVAVKQAATLMPGHPALVLSVWGPPAPEDGASPEAVQTEAHAEVVAADGALLGHQLGIDCRPRTRRQGTTVAEAIVAEAERAEAGAIIVGRGGGPDGASLGSVSRAVVRDAACAVLLAAGTAARAASSTQRLDVGAAA
ncbi:MAG TPA: universal stress protein [Solirubrobacteraceae bacterium]|nr:universal stress protein [Solirubrobacteraceae bacterium]